MKQKRKQLRIIAPAKTEKLAGKTNKPVSARVIPIANMRTGRTINMSAKAAGMLNARYPKEFKIL